MGAKFKSGSANPNWKGGVSTTEKGYLRIYAGPDRKKYFHRVTLEKLPGPLALNRPLRSTEEVHHQCFNRACRNPEHWILMDAPLHEKSQKHIRRRKQFVNAVEFVAAISQNDALGTAD